MVSGEATNTNFIIFDLTRPGLEPTIYRTWGKHANHYATDAVLKIWRFPKVVIMKIYNFIIKEEKLVYCQLTALLSCFVINLYSFQQELFEIWLFTLNSCTSFISNFLAKLKWKKITLKYSALNFKLKWSYWCTLKKNVMLHSSSKMTGITISRDFIKWLKIVYKI